MFYKCKVSLNRNGPLKTQVTVERCVSSFYFAVRDRLTLGRTLETTPNGGESYRTIVDEKQNSTMFIVDLPQGVYLGKSINLVLE